MKKTILSIEGMTCSACSNGLEKYLNKQDGINKASVNLIMNSASIEHDDKKVSKEDLDRFVKEAGFKSLGKYILNFEEKQTRKEKIKFLFITIFTILIFYISMSNMLNLPQIHFLSMDNNPINYACTLFLLTTIVVIFGVDILKNGLKNLIHKTPNMDTLITIGILASYLYSLYETIMIVQNIDISKFVHTLYFESSAMVIFFIKLGRLIENNNKNKTKEALQKLVTITPKDAVIIRNNEEKDVTIDEIEKGDIVICRPGQKIAVDGEVIEGETHVDESFITGESKPVKKNIGDKVIAGSINYEGSIRYKAEKIGRESTVSEIVKMVAEATNNKAPIGNLADRISGVFVPVVIIISILTLIIWQLITNDLSTAINYFVSVLVIACPCSLGLATPLAIVTSTGKATSNGILVKSGEALENAHKIKNIFFDKTGTLTYGKLKVEKIYNYSDEKEEDILKYVATIEKKSEHPIAKAIVDYAKERKIMIVACKDFKAIPGEGVYAKIKDDEFYIGNEKIIANIVATNGRRYEDTCDIVAKHSVLQESEEILTADIDDNKKNCSLVTASIARHKDELTSSGNSILFVVKNGKIISLIGLKDMVRESSTELVTKLNEKNINTIMLTGDNIDTAKKVAGEIGIKEVIANCSPKEKSEKIAEYKEKGITAMCGDGINDSVSLVNSDIGIAISNGTDVSINSAEVVLMNDNLLKILDLIEISKKTIKVIKQNLFWACIYNLCMIPVACGIFAKFGVKVNPMIGSFAMMMSSIIVVLNSLRLKK